MNDLTYSNLIIGTSTKAFLKGIETWKKETIIQRVIFCDFLVSFVNNEALSYIFFHILQYSNVINFFSSRRLRNVWSKLQVREKEINVLICHKCRIYSLPFSTIQVRKQSMHHFLLDQVRQQTKKPSHQMKR